MNTLVKWVLGILLGLAALVLVIAIGYFVLNGWGNIGWVYGGRAFRIWDGGRVLPWHWMPMHPAWGIPLVRFGAFFPWGMIFGGVIWLGLLVLVVLGALALARAISGSMGSPGATCPNCGRPVQADWRLCPYCGQALKENRSGENQAV